jgi:hypothetical protein
MAFKQAENPDVRTTDDHFLMEVSVHNNEEELISFQEYGAVEVKVIESINLDMKRVYKITLLFGITILVASCHNNSAPNYQYFPNMYESIGYETYSESKAFKMVRKVNFLPQGLLKRSRTLWLRGLPAGNAS